VRGHAPLDDAFVEPNDDLRVTSCEALSGFAAPDLSGTVY